MTRVSANQAQRVPSGPAREKLRQHGQFWTPDWIADAMVAYAMRAGGAEIFDPAVGAGAFFRAARRQQAEARLRGTEIAPDALTEARASGLSAADLSEVEIRDFVLQPPRQRYTAIVANPPYVRHHRLTRTAKTELRRFARQLTGSDLDGRAGLHVYFLLRALDRLAPGGRLAFIVPADLFEGVFASTVWRWISRHFRLDAVVTFTPEAAPFPSIDTNALIVLIAHEPPRGQFLWAVCSGRDGPALARWAAHPELSSSPALSVQWRELQEALAGGLSRPPRTTDTGSHVLGEFAAVMRGIATGANDFFFLNSRQVNEFNLPGAVLTRAIGRTRDVGGREIVPADLDRLDAAGRPTFLLSLDTTPLERLPPSVRAYLRLGAKRGLAQRALISSRSPWYKMEHRPPPPLLFAYLGRRSARFLRNRTSAVPLTGFLCVYPRPQFLPQLDALWAALDHPATVANLHWVGKSYGAGAIKVEPRALERLPVPDEVLRQAGLQLSHELRQINFDLAG